MGYWSPVEQNILISRMGQPIIYFKTNKRNVGGGVLFIFK